jgi:glutamine cyclotransferase
MIRRLIVAALFAVATVSVSTPMHAATSVAAIRPQSNQIVETYYYSDSSYTQQVGYTFENFCTGRVRTEGQVTPYYLTNSYWCYA